MKKIKNKQQYYQALAQVEQYLEKGFANLTPEEDEHLSILSRAVESWELAAFPMLVKSN